MNGPGCLRRFEQLRGAVVEDHQFGDRFGWRNRVAEAFGSQRGDEAFSQGIVIGIPYAVCLGLAELDGVSLRCDFRQRRLQL